MHTIALAVLLALKGTLCFGPKECTRTTAAKIDVTTANVERRFVWTSDDGATVILGTLPAKAASLDLESKEPVSHEVTLTLHGDVHRGWPSDVRFRLGQGAGREWEWVEPAKAVGKPIAIRVPAARYQLQIVAEHHKSERRPVDTHLDVALHDVTLAPLPVISGRVVTLKKTSDDGPPKEVPVANAQILTAQTVRGPGQTATNTKPQTSTDEQGAFRTELGEPEPFEIVVMAPGLATRLVHLALSAPETDLGLIRMAAGAKLTVHLQRADSIRAKTIHVALYERSPQQYENTFLEKRDAKAGTDDLVFENLGEGDYYVLLSGDEPLENLATTVAMKKDDVTKEIRIAPFTLAGSVTFGEEPLREGRAGLSESSHTWRAELPIDSEGHFGGTMWQRDSLSGFIDSKATGVLMVDQRPSLEGDPAPWDIRLKRRTIAGRVFDDETKEPVANTVIELQVAAKTSTFYTTVKVNPDGAYAIVALKDGVYDMQVKAPGHVVASKSVTVAEADGSQTVDFPLSRGVSQEIDVVWPAGEPVAGAMVVEGVARDGHNPGWYGVTDATGKLTLRSAPNTARTLFVVPHEGSFAVVRVPASTTEAQPMRVVVPQPAASLTVSLVTADQKPAPGRVEMRYNGEWVPLSVVFPLMRQAGSGVYRFPLMPAGAYELWAERPRVMDNVAPARTPVRVGLSVGEQAATLELPAVP